MKRNTTKEILAESFQEIAAKKEFGKITINDIVENCALSPATFYRYFRDKYDLIAWKFAQDCHEIVKRFDGSSRKREEIAEAWVAYCEQNRPILLNLLTNTSGNDSFIHAMTQEQSALIEERIIAHSGKDRLTEWVRMKIYIYCSGSAWLTWAWLRGEIPVPAKEVAETILEMIQESILPLFDT